jgi:SAM-dependent methyltransferase
MVSNATGRQREIEEAAMAERRAGGSTDEPGTNGPEAGPGTNGPEAGPGTNRPGAGRGTNGPEAGRGTNGAQAARGAGHRRPGSEFEGVLGLVAGWAMGIKRGRSTRLVADLAGVRAGDRVVDVGCGPGTFLREAAERGATAVGVDPSAQMRRLAVRRIPAALRPAITVTEGTAERLPLGDGSATVAWAVASYHHWDDPAAGLAEVHRVLEPGGRLLVAEGLARPRRWFQHHALTWDAAEDLAAKARQAGFADVTATRHSLGRRQFVVVAGRRPADPS